MAGGEHHMNTLSVSPETQQAVEGCKKSLGMIQHRLLTTFSFVPDDKLTYAPAETCKTSIGIIVHCANSNHFFAHIIAKQKMMDVDPAEAQKEAKAKELSVTSRDEAIQMLNDSIKVVEAALDTVNDETINAVIETPIVTMPMNFWMNLPGRHMDNHASQIDYIQTIWGDMDWHLG
jgi:uncharacterized damage-inducible protein DinB